METMKKPLGPFRMPEEGRRPTLTFREKAISAAKGLLKLEPLLEINKKGMDTDFSRAERLKCAIGLGKGASSDLIFSYLSEEHDSAVKEALAYAFVESFRRTMEGYNTSLYRLYSALGSKKVLEEKNAYSTHAKRYAICLLKGVQNIPENGRRALETVIEDQCETPEP